MRPHQLERTECIEIRTDTMVIRIRWGTTVYYTRLRSYLSESPTLHSRSNSEPKGYLHGALAFFRIFSLLSLGRIFICVCLWEDRNVNLERSLAGGIMTYIRAGAGAGAASSTEKPRGTLENHTMKSISSWCNPSSQSIVSRTLRSKPRGESWSRRGNNAQNGDLSSAILAQLRLVPIAQSRPRNIRGPLLNFVASG